MQVTITEVEQSNIKTLTTGKGRTKWVLEKTGISATPLQKMKELRRADQECVIKMRAFLKTKEAKDFIAQNRETAIAS